MFSVCKEILIFKIIYSESSKKISSTLFKPKQYVGIMELEGVSVRWTNVLWLYICMIDIFVASNVGGQSGHMAQRCYCWPFSDIVYAKYIELNFPLLFFYLKSPSYTASNILTLLLQQI